MECWDNICILRRSDRYSVLQQDVKEVLGVVLSLEHFRPPILGSFIQIFCDQRKVKWLLNQDHPSKFVRYRLRLGCHDFNVNHIAGNKNKVADYLSHYIILRNEKNGKGRFIVHDDEQANFFSSVYEKHRLEFQILNLAESKLLLRKLLKSFCFGDKRKVHEIFKDFLIKKREASELPRAMNTVRDSQEEPASPGQTRVTHRELNAGLKTLSQTPYATETLYVKK